MANILMAFDEQDATMGSFNQGCFESYQEYLNGKEFSVTYINSAQLNEANIQLRTSMLSPFVFAAYSHGSENGELLSTQGIYLSTTVNQTSFGNSFVYTVSCHVGSSLAKCMIDNGCLSFLGYKSFFYFWDGYKCFSDCANFGLFLFLEKINTLEVHRQMIMKYDDEIDKIYLSDYLVASLLRENRDALIHLGNDITIEDLL